MKIILFLVLVLVVSTGCASDQTVRVKLLNQTSSLYQVYLTGSRDDARRSLQEANRLIENAKLSPQYQEDQACALFLGYGRLYALEHRAGNYNMAQMYIIKARYWCLRSVELHGDSPIECIAHVNKFATEDKLLAFIDKWDKDANNGKAPIYIQSP